MALIISFILTLNVSRDTLVLPYLYFKGWTFYGLSFACLTSYALAKYPRNMRHLDSKGRGELLDCGVLRWLGLQAVGWLDRRCARFLLLGSKNVGTESILRLLR